MIKDAKGMFLCLNEITGGMLPCLTYRDVPRSRVSFCVKVMGHGVLLSPKLWNRVL